MTQAELNYAVAEATGESLGTIDQHGFVLLRGGPYEREPAHAYDDLLAEYPDDPSADYPDDLVRGRDDVFSRPWRDGPYLIAT